MSRGPSLTALLGMLAIAGYQNRDKISEWLGGMAGAGAPAGGGTALPGGQAGPAPGGMPGGLGGLLGQLTGQGRAPDAGGFLGGALGGLVDQFKQNGRGDVAQSWIGTGPNQPIEPTDLEGAIGSDTLSTLEQQTGLSRQEILARLSRELPNAVDRYTPDGRLPGA